MEEKEGNTPKRIIMLLSLFIFTLVLVQTVHAAPNVIQVSKSVVANADGTISATIVLRNDGDQTAPDFLVEIDPRLGSCFLAAVTVSPQSVCDPTYPKNVHVFVSSLAPAESVTVNLMTPQMPDGTYCVVGKTADSCCPDNPDCQSVPPYGWNTPLGYVTVTGGVTPVCGDGVCAATENPANCPAADM